MQKLAKEYAETLLRDEKITREQVNIVIDSVVHGYKSAMSLICNLSKGDSVYLIPDYACELITDKND